MSIVPQLATSLGRRDEEPNKELAKAIIERKDKKAVGELVNNLKNKNKGIQADCIKTLYEIGAEQPVLIKDYVADFIQLLKSKNNRLVWGGMIALNAITTEKADQIYEKLPDILAATNQGSVIARDNFVRILIRLEAMKKFKGQLFPLLLEQLATCPTNQLPMYAEDAFEIIDQNNNEQFITVLMKRLSEVGGEAKKNRINKLIKKVSGKS